MRGFDGLLAIGFWLLAIGQNKKIDNNNNNNNSQ